MSKEYIDREALLAYLEDVNVVCLANLEFETYDNLKEIMREIKNGEIPAADVIEVVRCKDCKHLTFSDCYGECGKGYRGWIWRIET